MTKKIAVLMGGKSAEREVSLETGRAVAGTLRELGHSVVEVDVDKELPLKLSREEPDIAFIALHGRGGEDGTVQGLLEVMRIPYTGPGVLASAITIDKVTTKELLRYHDVPVAGDIVAVRGQSTNDVRNSVAAELGYPVMVKPACEGSSIGVTCVTSEEVLSEALETVFSCDTRALIERFVSGRLLTIGILGREEIVLPVLEITPREGFYDYEAKYSPGMTDYEVPAKLELSIARTVQEMSLKSFRVLGCEGVSRVDFILEDDTLEPYFLEINTMPGMTQTSLLPKAAEAAGIGFEQVVSMILEGARLKIDLPE